MLAYSAIGSSGFGGSYNTVKPVLFTASTLNCVDCMKVIYNKLLPALPETWLHSDQCRLTIVEYLLCEKPGRERAYERLHASKEFRGSIRMKSSPI